MSNKFKNFTNKDSIQFSNTPLNINFVDNSKKVRDYITQKYRKISHINVI